MYIITKRTSTNHSLQKSKASKTNCFLLIRSLLHQSYSHFRYQIHLYKNLLSLYSHFPL